MIYCRRTKRGGGEIGQKHWKQSVCISASFKKMRDRVEKNEKEERQKERKFFVVSNKEIRK